jgi:hypothetical protein
VRQIHREEVDLALDAADHTDRFTKVGLTLPGGCTNGTNISWRPLAPTDNVVLHDRDLAVNLRSSRSRSKSRLDVCRCFFGRSLSDARIASITPLNSSNLGRNGGFLRKYPGGTQNFSIFETVLALWQNDPPQHAR